MKRILDVIDVLRARHRAIDAAFAQLRRDTSALRATTFLGLARELAHAMTHEQRIVLAALVDDDLSDAVSDILDDHLVVARTLAELIELDPGEHPRAFEHKLSLLAGDLADLHREMERRVFPHVRARLSVEMRAMLAERLHAAATTLSPRSRPRPTPPAPV